MIRLADLAGAPEHLRLDVQDDERLAQLVVVAPLAARLLVLRAAAEAALVRVLREVLLQVVRVA